MSHQFCVCNQCIKEYVRAAVGRGLTIFEAEAESGVPLERLRKHAKTVGLKFKRGHHLGWVSKNADNIILWRGLRGEGKTFAEIAKMHGISRQRVEQVLRAAKG